MITKIDHVVIFVTDMEHSIDFYTSILGLEVAYPSSDYTSLSVPGSTTIGLHTAEKVAGIDSGMATTQVSFGVENIEQAYTKLKEKGVEILTEIEEIAPKRFMFNFVDPDKNQLSCYQVKSGN